MSQKFGYISNISEIPYIRNLLYNVFTNSFLRFSICFSLRLNEAWIDGVSLAIDIR